MFRKRQNFKKPSEELISRFKQEFPLVTTTAPAGGLSHQLHHRQLDLDDLRLPDVEYQPRNDTADSGVDGVKGPSTVTSRAKDDHFMPSMLDPTMLGFSLMEAHGHHGSNPSWAPSSPASANTLYHQAAGDLHLASAAMSVLTPTCAPTAVQLDSASYQWAALPPAQLLGQHGEQVQLDGRFSATAGHGVFATRDVFAGIDSSLRGPGFSGDVDMAFGLSAGDEAAADQTPAITHNESFRYHAVLHAPTAMVEAPGEDPMTYLNKGQPYSLTIQDRGLFVPTFHLPRYRTHVWISFNDPERRSTPDACWQLWKEGRGMNEAQQSGNKLVAVEFLPTGGKVDDEKPRSTQLAHVQIEGQSYNGFSVLWGSATSSPRPECAITLRLNFVSTDFTRSKGVKGIPVRLCTRTEEISPGNVGPASAEVSYCVVQVFRDHGAARKIANDTDQLKRKILKLKRDMELPDSRKRRGSRHDISVVDSDDQKKIALLESKLLSARPASLLNLRGDDSDLPRLSSFSTPADVEMEDVQHTVTSSKETMFTTVQSTQTFGDIEVSGHDSVRQTIDVTARRPSTAVAHFYIRTQPETYYRAIYLTERTLADFISAVAAKYTVEPSQVHLVLHVDQKGRQIVVDDEVVRALPEGQDMILEFGQLSDDDSTPTGETPENASSSPGLEIKLFF